MWRNQEEEDPLDDVEMKYEHRGPWSSVAKCHTITDTDHPIVKHYQKLLKTTSQILRKGDKLIKRTDRFIIRESKSRGFEDVDRQSQLVRNSVKAVRNQKMMLMVKAYEELIEIAGFNIVDGSKTIILSRMRRVTLPERPWAPGEWESQRWQVVGTLGPAPYHQPEGRWKFKYELSGGQNVFGIDMTDWIILHQANVFLPVPRHQ